MTTMWKASLITALLFSGLMALGQSLPAAGQTPPGPLDSGLGPSTRTATGSLPRPELFHDEEPPLNFDDEVINSILFYRTDNGGTSVTGLTLVASKLEDKSDRNDPFTGYRWFYMGQDPDNQIRTAFLLGTASHIQPEGLEKSVGTGDAHKLSVNGLTPGYHIFQVEGIMNPDGAESTDLCEPEVETIVLYVLPPLKVSANGEDPSGNFQYCETDAATQEAVTITSSTEFVSGSEPVVSPGVDAFEKRYRFYAIKQQSDKTFTQFDSNNVDIDPTTLPGVTLLNGPGMLTVGGEIGDFKPNMAEYGKYQIMLEVEYTVKDRQFRTPGDADGIRVRPHVIYRSIVMHNSQPLEITVTPKPGKPHITIENVID